MDEQVDQKQKTLKRVMIILGVLIIIAVVVLIVGLIQKATNKGDGMETIVAASPSPAFGELGITMPPNSRVLSTNVTPYEIHALMLTPFGQRLVVIDRTTGQILGSVKFTPERPAQQ